MTSQAYEQQVLLSELLYDRTVALVGGAKKWERNQDRFNYVVRVNFSFLEQGGRCDGIYAGPGTPLVNNIRPPRFMVFAGNFEDAENYAHFCATHCVLPVVYFSDHFATQSKYGPEHEWLNTFQRELGTLPLTGILAVRQLTLMPIRSLFITGMDFYLTNNVIPYTVCEHKITPQIVWLKRLCELDKRVSVDITLERIFRGDYKLQPVKSWEANGHVFEQAT